MKKVIFCVFIALLLVSSGCSIFDNRPRIKEVANKLDAIPVGTPLDQIPWLVQISYLNNPEVDNFHQIPPKDVFTFLWENPVKKNSIDTLYRQVPSGILIYVTTNDYELTPPVIEDGDNDWLSDDAPFGQLAVFFDSEQKYKGYFAWSWGFGACKDSKERMETERKKFVDSGTIKWSEYAQNVVDTDHFSKKMEQHVPKVPLYLNAEQLATPIPDFQVRGRLSYGRNFLNLSDNEDRLLYSAVLDLVASSSFNSDRVKLRATTYLDSESTKKYSEEYQEARQQDSENVDITFKELQTIHTLAGDIHARSILVVLNRSNSTVVVFTAEDRNNIIAHDKLDDKLCAEFFGVVDKVTEGK